MATYYLEFTQVIRSKDSDTRLIEAASKSEALKKLEEELVKEYGKDLISVNVESISNC